MTKEDDQASIKALLKERRGYELRGLTERMAEVDAQLAQLGHKAETPRQRSQKRPAQKKGATSR